jgi:uncharacterized protein (DUF1800 family)
LVLRRPGMLYKGFVMTSSSDFFAASKLPLSTATAPDAVVAALNRMTYGVTPELVADVRTRGIKSYLEEQLEPKPGQDEKLAGKLAGATLPIKYPEKDGVPGVDEDRPLKWLNATTDELWKLTDREQKVPYQEGKRAFEEIRAASWLRATYSQWQLKEMLVEFWHNHFNVNASDYKTGVVFPVYDREVIRQHALGNFREFLEGVAKSTAMLYYLDNFTSKASPANENYARELFELHTLGSDNYFNNLYNRWRDVPGALQGKAIGYIDEDVYEAARAFTGWTVADGASVGRDKLPNTGKFHYYDPWHDNYQKRILGHEIAPNQPALADGHLALDLVAFHPGTARHLCKKLCARFIADDPPASVVQGAVKVWTRNQKSPDQLAQVVRYILSSREFSNTWGQKVKSPFHLMVSLFRATQADIQATQQLSTQLQPMGYYHYNWLTPTGHPDRMDYWLSSSSLLARWNATTGIVSTAPHNKLATYDFTAVLPIGMDKPADLAPFWIERILQRKKPAAFVQAMTDFLAGGNDAAGKPIPGDKLNARLSGYVGLLAMTPDFQLV